MAGPGVSLGRGLSEGPSHTPTAPSITALCVVDPRGLPQPAVRAEVGYPVYLVGLPLHCPAADRARLPCPAGPRERHGPSTPGGQLPGARRGPGPRRPAPLPARGSQQNQQLGARLGSLPHPALGSPASQRSRTGRCLAHRGWGQGVRNPVLGLVLPFPSGPCGTSLGRTGSLHRDGIGRSLWKNKSKVIWAEKRLMKLTRQGRCFQEYFSSEVTVSLKAGGEWGERAEGSEGSRGKEPQKSRGRRGRRGVEGQRALLCWDGCCSGQDVPPLRQQN